MQFHAIVIGERPVATPSHSDDPAEFDRLRTALWGETEGPHDVGRGQVNSGPAPAAVLQRLGIGPDFLIGKPESRIPA